MKGPTILSLLGCSVIVLAANPQRNLFAKSGANYGARRPQPIDTNTYTEYLDRRDDVWGDDFELWALEKIRHRLNSEVDPQIASVAIAAAESVALVISRMSNEAAIAVAETVANTLADAHGRSGSSAADRRHFNVNTNSNTNIVRLGRARERNDNRGLGSSEDLTPPIFLYDQPYAMARAIERGIREPEEDELEEEASAAARNEEEMEEILEEENQLTSLERVNEDNDNEEEQAVDTESVPNETYGNRKLRRPIRGNTNRSHPRRGYGANDDNAGPHPRSNAAYHQNSNSNANTNIINYRRDVSPNFTPNGNKMPPFGRNTKRNFNDKIRGSRFRSRQI